MNKFINLLAIVVTFTLTFCAFTEQKKVFQQWKAQITDTVPTYNLTWTGFSIHRYENMSQFDGSLVQSEGYVATISDTSITCALTGYLVMKWTSDTTMAYQFANPNYSYIVTFHDNWSWIEYKMVEYDKIVSHTKLY